MYMKRIYTLMLLLMGVSTIVMAQNTRYVDEVFTDVDVTTDIQYGANITIITVPETGMPSLDTLVVDVYTPSGDAATDRPLVMLFHTGNFLPQLVNGSVHGNKNDGYLVNLAQKLARRGYVVAMPYYRLGWNPIALEQDERTETLINAAYRGVQDSRAAARFFRRSIAEQGNPFGIDGEKFIAWGVGTGGYIALATTTLDAYEDVLLPKFTKEDENGMPIPMVIQELNGDPDGLMNAILNVPFHDGYDSDYQMCVNMGGAMGDISWLDESDPPIVSFHVPTDPFAPYNTDVLIVPTTGDFVVEVSGSYDVQSKANDLGVNAVFADGIFNDVYTEAANANNDGLEGLMPFPRPSWPTDPNDPTVLTPLEASPWEFWDEALWSNEPFGQLGLNGMGGPCEGVPIELCNWHLISLGSNPDMSLDKANVYQDSIMGYFGPRACLALNLADCAWVYTSAGDEYISNEISIAPNPVQDQFTISTEDLEISSVGIFDVTGQSLYQQNNVQSNSIQINRGEWRSGFYFARIQINDRFITKKFILE